TAATGTITDPTGPAPTAANPRASFSTTTLTVAEGGDVDITLNLTPAASTGNTIEVAVVETRSAPSGSVGFIDSAEFDAVAAGVLGFVTDGSGSIIYQLTIDNDMMTGGGGTIVLTIAPEQHTDGTYTIGSPSMLTITVTDAGAPDTTRPTVMIRGANSLVTGATTVITLTTSEATTDFAVGDITRAGVGSLSGFSGSGTGYTVTFNAGASPGTATLSVAANRFNDAADNGNTASTTHVITVTAPPPDDTTLTLSGPSGGAADEGTYVPFVVTLGAMLDADAVVPVTITAAPGNTITNIDTAGEIMGTAPSQVTIPGGMLTATFSVRTTNDVYDGSDGSLTAMISQPTSTHDEGITLGTDTVSVTIRDDDDAPEMRVDDTRASEQTGALVFTVGLTQISGNTVTVMYATGPGSPPNAAIAPGDYDSASGTLTFAPGIREQGITVTIKTDADMVDDNLMLTLSSPVNATFATNGNTAVGTISELPSLGINAEGTVTEGNAIVFMLGITEMQTVAVDVPVEIVAVPPSAIGTTPSSVTIPASETMVTFSVTTTDDSTDRPDATVTATITSPDADVYALQKATANITIRDDDDLAELSVADARTGEATGMLVFTVSLSPASGKSVTVMYATSDGAADGMGTDAVDGTNYTAASGTLSFAPDVTEQQVTIAIMADTEDELDNLFTLRLSNPVNADLAADASAATGTIGEIPIISISGATSFTEGTPAIYTLSVVPAQSDAVMVPVTIAASPTDLIGSTPDSVTIPANTSSVVFSVATGNQRDDADGTITATISAPAGLESDLGTATVTATVIDNDAPPGVTVAAGEAAFEGEPLTFSITLRAVSGKEISVDYATADGGTNRAGISEAATAGSDYTSTSGTLVIPAGELGGTVQVNTLSDEETEEEETLSLTISNPVNASIADADATAVGTIMERRVDYQAVNETVMPQVGINLATQAGTAIQGRINSAFDGTPVSASSLTLQGASPMQLLARHAQSRAGAYAQGQRAASVNMPRDIGFIVPLVQQADAGGSSSNTGLFGNEGPPITLWGRTFHHDSNGSQDEVNYDGDLQGAMVGIDVATGNEVWGVSFVQANSDFIYDVDGSLGTHDISLSGLHPYAGFQLDSGARMWASLGFNQGDVTITQNNNPGDVYTSDVSMQSFALGGDSPARVIRSGTYSSMSMGFTGDALYTTNTEKARSDGMAGIESSNGRLRLGVELTHQQQLEASGNTSSSLELNWRQDFGDGFSGGGAELGGEINITIPQSQLTIGVDARGLLYHSSGLNEWGVGINVAWAARPDNRGLSLTFAPQWGATGSRAQQLWQAKMGDFYQSPNATGTANNFNAKNLYGLELKYGIPVLNDKELLELFARTKFTAEHDTMSLGADLKFGQGFSAGYEAALGQGAYAPSNIGGGISNGIGGINGTNTTNNLASPLMRNLQPGTVGYQFFTTPSGGTANPTTPSATLNPTAAARNIYHRAYLRYHKRF
ncbi:MAG: Calx-beta domain-containing protein, partial [Pseudohongiellaceae bacterium]